MPHSDSIKTQTPLEGAYLPFGESQNNPASSATWREGPGALCDSPKIVHDLAFGFTSLSRSGLVREGGIPDPVLRSCDYWFLRFR